MTKKHEFYACGEARECKQPPLHYTLCGLDNVWLMNGFEREEYDGEEYVSVQNVDGLWKAIGISLATTQNELSPQEIRFLRRHMQFSQEDLAKRLSVDVQTVARWEKQQTKISGPASLAIRTLFLTSARAQPEGERIIMKLFEAIEEQAKSGPKADDGRSTYSIEMIQTHDDWMAKLTDEKQYALSV